jgi:5-methylcytosine-specific restriction endonuclease McrA
MIKSYPKNKPYRIDRSTKAGQAEWLALTTDVAKRDGYMCQVEGCDKTVLANAIDPHHIVYLSRGGSDTIDNLILICNKHHDDIHQHKIECPKIMKGGGK